MGTISLTVSMPSAGLPPDCVLFPDDREPYSVQERLRDEYDGIIEHWEFGDYYIAAASRLIGIERKTISDLLSSLSEGRLDSQLEGLTGSVDVPILLIQGELRASPGGFVLVTDGVASGWNYHSVLNKLQTFQEMGVRLTFCEEGDQALIDRILSLARYYCKPHHALAPRIHGLQVFSRERNPATLALAQLPGVGVDRARALLAHFGSLQAVTNASVKELRFVTGIGPKVAKRVHEICR